MARLTLKCALILCALLLCAGCGGSTTATAAPASWEGTWSGKVDWVSVSGSSSDPSAGDTVTITIGAPVPTPCQSCRSALTVSLFTGTDVGPELGDIALQGQIDLYADDLTGSVVSPSITGNPYSTAIQPEEVWELNGNSITITGIGTNSQDQSISLLMGTLTLQ